MGVSLTKANNNKVCGVDPKLGPKGSVDLPETMQILRGTCIYAFLGERVHGIH